MTRKQALLRAITVLGKNPEYAEDIRILQEICDELPLIHWSDSSIRDTVEQFILDNGRVPTASDFKKKGMPPHPVIKQKYKITLGEWLEKHYPVRKPTYEELKEKIAEYEDAFNNPYVAAGLGYVDDIIEPALTRQAVISAFDVLSTKCEASPAKKHGNIPL